MGGSLSWAARCSSWLDDASLGLVRAGALLRRARRIQLVEQDDGGFVVARAGSPSRPAGEPLRFEDGRIVGLSSQRQRTLVAGKQIDLVLKPSRFIFRPLELPARAVEFIEGVVRAQVDRLTPWSAAEAAFGWSAPRSLGADRVVVTVAASARATIVPIVQALVDQRADSVLVSTAPAGGQPQSPPIHVFVQRSGMETRVRRLRRKLIAVLAVAVAAFAVGAGAEIIAGSDLEAQRIDLERQIALRRADLLRGAGAVADDALAGLEARKRASPASVIVLEALSRTLPDDTYLNELRIEGGKVQIAGLTRDAPALIRFMEQSRQFSHATFFAPTTKAPTEEGERFHIEAQIEPMFRTPQQ